MALDVKKSVVLISSTNSENNFFGTGFVIHKDQEATYVVTCAHVVDSVGGAGSVAVDKDKQPATVLASDPPHDFDVAVLRIQGILSQPILTPGSVTAKGNSFITAGFYEYGHTTLDQQLKGKLDADPDVLSFSSGTSVSAWHINIQEDQYFLQPGYSGAPVIDAITGRVWGIVNNRKGDGRTGLAVSIEAVKKIWQNRPAGIFEEMDAANKAEDNTIGVLQSKAVIFTHFGSLRHHERFLQDEDQYISKYAEILNRFIQCNRNEPLIKIVYIYVDWAVRKAIPTLRVEQEESGENRFLIGGKLLQEEKALKGILKSAERHARQISDWIQEPPTFVYVGLDELVEVLNNLINIDPDMPHFLCGSQGHFTYDSPKFVEAIIRLSRTDIPNLASHPIIRVDEDAEINPHAIKCLLAKFIEVSGHKPFFFFSGKYCRTEDDTYDPINDYAVRAHWFFPPGTKAGDKRFKNPDATFQQSINLAKKFLSDMTTLGATQLQGHAKSSALDNMLKTGALTEPTLRKSRQVISGAGLIMSRRNIDLLPPFMNFEHMTSWIDDHLKRRLHEMLGDMSPNDLESVSSACFQQERPPEKLTQEFIDDSNQYFERLLRGCLFHHIITDPEGKPTDYSTLIRDIAWYKTKELSDTTKQDISQKISELARERYDIILDCWSSPEFEGTASYTWAKQCSTDSTHREKLCNPHDGEVVEDALAYIDLMLKWHIFTRSIERLSFIANSWLFEPVDP